MGAKSTDMAENSQCRPDLAAGVPGAPAPRQASAARVQPRGCKGRSPLHKKTKNLPLPAGKSALRARVRGMGAGKHAKGKVDRRQKGKPPTVTTPCPLTPLFEKSSEGSGGLFQESPGVLPPSAQENPRKINPIRLPREFLKKPLTNARRCGIIRPVMEA